MRIKNFLRFGVALAGLTVPTIAFAQAAPSDSDTSEAEAIVVTGTRLKTSGFDAPTPVSVISIDQIQQAAPARISDFVNQLPALASSNTPRTNKALIGNGLAGANLLNLRSLGFSRTLVMLNGRRVTPTTVTGAVDVNTLPTSLVSRVDVVTGGASAAWGSDAVAGVVNFVLDTKFTGLKMEVQGGISGHGDAGNVNISGAYGTSFAGGRGHFVVAGQYTKDNEALYVKRDWYQGYKIIPSAGIAGQPTNFVSPWVTQYANTTGLVSSGVLKGYYFDATGGLAGTNFPTANLANNFYYGDKATYDRLFDQSLLQQAAIPGNLHTLYSRLTYDVSDNVSFFVEGSYAGNKNSSAQAAYARTGGNSLSIAKDNFFLPAAVATAMNAQGLATLPVAIFETKLGNVQYDTERRVYRGLVGLEGSLSNGWKWDLSYQYGRVNSDISAAHMPITANFNNAIDVVANTNPALGALGIPVCRSSLTNPTNGCVVLNPFGTQAPSTAALGYVLGTTYQKLHYTQQVVDANLSGSLLKLPAGDVSFSLGAEYRSEKAVAEADPLSQTAAAPYFAGNFKVFSGSFNVKEAYLEFGIPVLKNSSLGRSLDLNLAGRVTDYSTSGTVATWKAGFTYKPVDDLEFRLTRSRDIRAPNVNELFQTGLVANQLIVDPLYSTANSNYRVTQTTSGNPLLEAEKANTLTFGVVLQPRFMPGFRASIDYYNIDIKGAIAVNSSQFILDQCKAGIQIFCDAITRDLAPLPGETAKQISAINLRPFNARSEKAKGIDIEAAYTTRVGGEGSLNFRLMANYVDTLTIFALNGTTTRAGEAGNNLGAAEGVPHWRATASITYDSPRFTGQLKGRYIGPAIFDDAYTPSTININSVPSVTYLDAYFAVKFGSEHKAEVFVGIDNIFNKAPPVVTPQDNSNTSSGGTNVFLYDVIGRYFKAGARFKF